MLRFYRTTEGVIIALSIYVALCVGVSAAWAAVSAGPLLLAGPFVLTMLVLGGIGIYLYADAVQRLFDALLARFGDLIIEIVAP